MDNKKALLIIMGGLWACIIAYDTGLFGSTEGKTAFVNKNKSERETSRKEEKTVALNNLLEIKIENLKKSRPAYKGVVKDIFSPLKLDPPKPLVVAPPPPPTPKPPSQLEVFASQLKFIGFLEKREGKTVFFTRGSNVFLVKKGDLLENKFKVVDVAGNMMILKDEIDGEEAKVFLTVR